MLVRQASYQLSYICWAPMFLSFSSVPVDVQSFLLGGAAGYIRRKRICPFSREAECRNGWFLAVEVREYVLAELFSFLLFPAQSWEAGSG